jgi:hypothetical protein
MSSASNDALAPGEIPLPSTVDREQIMTEPDMPTPNQFGLTEVDVRTNSTQPIYIVLLLRLVLVLAMIVAPIVGFVQLPPLGVLLIIPVAFVLVPVYEWLDELEQTIKRRLNPKHESIVRYELACVNYERALRAHAEYTLKVQEGFWRALSGRAFESELGKLFSNAGYTVKMTPATSDGGVDLVLLRGNETIVVQCKAHNKKISVGVARELVASMIDFKAKRGVIASLEGVTGPVHKYIEGKNISVIDIAVILGHIRNGSPLI